jgi:hypothetical protein
MLPDWLRLEPDLKALSFLAEAEKRDFDVFAQGVNRPFCRVSCRTAARLAKMLVRTNPVRTSRKSREPGVSSLPGGGPLL